jgi:hypothetical protein
LLLCLFFLAPPTCPIRFVAYPSSPFLLLQVRASFLLGNIDPTDGTGQFKDRGREFRPVLYVANDKERVLAEKSQELLVASGIYGQVRLESDASDHMCPHTTVYVSSCYYLCSHTTMYVSSFCFVSSCYYVSS